MSCTHCGKLGHEEANCFELIDYLDGWSTRRGRSSRGRGRNDQGGGRTNSGRGQRGYPGKEQVNAAQAHDSSGATGKAEDHRSVLSRIIENQVQKLLSLIEALKDTQERLLGKHNWLLDSGVSYHMTGNLKLSLNLCDITPVPVGMPNGTIPLANKRGSVRLNDKLMLSDVLYVPSLNCNLISIA